MINELPILLVEDNPDDVLLTLRAFTKNRIKNQVVVATDGEQALHRLLPDDRGAAAPGAGPARHQPSQDRRARGAAPDPRGRAHPQPAGGRAHHLERGA